MLKRTDLSKYKRIIGRASHPSSATCGGASSTPDQYSMHFSVNVHRAPRRPHVSIKPTPSTTAGLALTRLHPRQLVQRCGSGCIYAM